MGLPAEPVSLHLLLGWSGKPENPSSPLPRKHKLPASRSHVEEEDGGSFDTHFVALHMYPVCRSSSPIPASLIQSPLFSSRGLQFHSAGRKGISYLEEIGVGNWGAISFLQRLPTETPCYRTSGTVAPIV